MLAALAGVWLLVFVPSWATSTKEREARRQQYEIAKNQQKSDRGNILASPSSLNASKVRSAKVMKRIFGFGTLAFIALAVWSLTLMPSTAAWWVWASGSALGVAVCVWFNRLAESKYSLAIAQSAKVSPKLKFGVSTFDSTNQKDADAVREQQADPRAWTATGVPTQLYRSATGTLATPKFAEILDLAEELEKREDETTFSTDTASINIDEIMRRRRSNG